MTAEQQILADGYQPRRMLSVILPIWCGLIVLAIVGSFLSLGASSLWLDELFTVYFADPKQATFAAFLDRASEDVHLPGYYSLVWAVGRMTGLDPVFAARGVSAASAAISIGMLYAALPHWVSRPARLFACALAATSITYFVYAQEGRSYGLSWVWVTALLMVAFGILREEGGMFRRLAIFTIIGVMAGLSHLYLVPIVGAMVAIMICLISGLYARIGLAVTGLTILGFVLTFLAWQADRVIADVSDTWFATDVDFLWRQTRTGIRILLGSTFEKSLSTVVIAAGFVALALMRRQGRSIQGIKPAIADITLLVGCAILGMGLAILVTFTYAPSYSFRYFLVLAPIYWMALGMVFEVVLRSGAKWLISGLLIFATLTFAGLSLRIIWADIPTKQPWRETAAFVDSLPQCDNAVLPVDTFADDFISDNLPSRLYGYYLKDGAARKWLSYSEEALETFPGTGAVKDVVADRIAGIDPCPILLWSVNHSDHADLEIARSALLESFKLHDDTRVILKTIMLPQSTLYMRLLGMSQQEEGYFLMVER